MQSRNNSIDVAKGITALLMVLAHTAYFAGQGGDPILGPLIYFINLTTFTVLLFLSGAGLYLSHLRHDISHAEFKQQKGRLAHRTFKLLLTYYFIIFLGSLPQLLSGDKDILTSIIRLLLFIDIPAYVEFLLPFLAFYLMVYFLRPALKSITSSFIWTIIFSILFYTIGTIYYSMNLPSEFLPLKSILFGHADWYRFPVFQYAPVFFIGAYFGKLIAFKDYDLELKKKQGLTFVLLALTFVIVICLKLVGNNDLLTRWPPNPLFLMVGLSYITVVIYVLEKYLTKFKFKALTYVGRNVFDYYIIHLVLLYLSQYLFKPALGTLAETLIYFLIIILTGTLIVYISNSHKFMGPLRNALASRSFDSMYFRAFYVFLGFWLLLIFSIRFTANYNPAFATLISNTFIDVNYQEKVAANFSIVTDLDRKMVFRIESNDPSFDKYKAAIFNIEVNNKGYDYRGVEVKIDDQVVQELERNTVDKYNFKVDPSAFAVGTHRIVAAVKGSTLQSSPLEFQVSYPLFVTWTIDWEGFDISDANLKAMENISSSFKMPMVQLVTPRVFIASDVSESRKSLLKNWVKARYALGDEIGMHLHMHYDLFNSCGLNYRTSPKWDARANGHDVPTSAYYASEFSALLDCSLNYFDAYDFPKPVTYRAGGWFIDLKNLKVLADHGFQVDTSAREQYVWGNLTGHWNVDPTRPPYLISNDDQNREDNTNNFSLIEVPNNGSDSTNNGFDVMKGRFDLNYENKGTPLSQMQVVTFMSHPHWFTKLDNSTMRSLMQYVSQYGAEDDKGAVIFTTIERIYDLRNNYD